jgi:hypothetical protein
VFPFWGKARQTSDGLRHRLDPAKYAAASVFASGLSYALAALPFPHGRRAVHLSIMCTNDKGDQRERMG